MFIDFITIIRYAWMDYDASRKIKSITDISARVSTNHVYKVALEDKTFVIAKLAYFGQYEHFVEDHTIINCLSNNLPYPYDNFLSRSLMKGDKLFVHRFKNDLVNAWVVFYRPVKILKRLPRQLNEEQIEKLGDRFARLHLSCDAVRNTLPQSSKTLLTDITAIRTYLQTEEGRFEFGQHESLILNNCDTFEAQYRDLNVRKMHRIPVFVDWNIGNFSVSPSLRLYSRWDYDWFRMSSRIMDFYFLSRVCSTVGDRTVFTYNVEPLMEDRFARFLRVYHQVFPLQENELRFLIESYRFFLLHYAIFLGKYFFHDIYASQLKREALATHLPSIEKFRVDDLLNKVLI